MSSVTSSTPVLDSKSAKKRKAKASTSSPATTPAPAYVKVNGAADGDHESESPYLKELQKQIRNVNKKLSAVAKTETTIADHPGISLDELVSKKKINADQKAQIQKKPQLEAQLAQLEEQQKNFNEFAAEFEGRMEKQKTSLSESHDADLQRIKQELAETAAKQAEQKVHDALKVVIQFLHAAAYKRTQEDVDADESRSYEALLFHIYQGNLTALNALESLIAGKEEKTTEPSGEEIDYTFAQLKLSAMAVLTEDNLEAHDAAQDSEELPITDPTTANAGLTELEDTATLPISAAEEALAEEVSTAVPEQTIVNDDAANAVGENWNPEASMTAQSVEDWVQVPRDPAETETGTAAPAPQQSTSNWADEAGAAAEETAVAAPIGENDGFSEVKRDRGGRGRGGYRGRGRGGQDGRGRGRGRGEFRGQGRGRGDRADRGDRGDRGAPRGGERQAS